MHRALVAAKRMSFQRALAWSLFWIGLSMLAATGIYYYAGAEQAEAFVTGYVLEKSLSVDNLFLFLTIFSYFGVVPKAQRHVLNYGIIGVIVLRGLLIFAGVELVQRFDWIMYVFGLIVLYSGFAMAFGKSDQFDAEKSRTVRFISRFFPITREFHGTQFFIRDAVRVLATPLFLVLAVIEVTDILFAVDSIPAIFAVTRNAYIIFASNILAVLGLRSMYFLLARVHEAFRFMKQGVGVVLWFVGAKMLAPAVWHGFELSNTITLAVVVAILLVAILLSVTIKERNDGDPA